jgi:hypothetical protein
MPGHCPLGSAPFDALFVFTLKPFQVLCRVHAGNTPKSRVVNQPFPIPLPRTCTEAAAAV